MRATTGGSDGPAQVWPLGRPRSGAVPTTSRAGCEGLGDTGIYPCDSVPGDLHRGGVDRPRVQDTPARLRPTRGRRARISVGPTSRAQLCHVAAPHQPNETAIGGRKEDPVVRANPQSSYYVAPGTNQAEGGLKHVLVVVRDVEAVGHERARDAHVIHDEPDELVPFAGTPAHEDGAPVGPRAVERVFLRGLEEEHLLRLRDHAAATSHVAARAAALAMVRLGHGGG